MNKRALSLTLTLLLILFALMPLASCIAPSSTATEVEDGIYSGVNQVRQDLGLAVLTRDPALDALAEQYSAAKLSEEMGESTELRYLLHNSWWVTYEGGSPRLDSDEAEQQVKYCLENQDLAEIMLRSEARATGVGVAIVGDTVYYTQVFDVLNAAGANGEPIRLSENSQAADPLWSQLEEFLVQDDTDGYAYIPDSFVCADFAAMLHNRAETAGIKTAYVSIDFTEGPAHALNAFNTTDRGLVYIDCTGQGFSSITSADYFAGGGFSGEYDKVAYIEVGRIYGLISLEEATSFDYAFYQSWSQQWADYEAEAALYRQKCDEYDRALAGRTVISDPVEYARLQKMYRELESMRSDLESQKLLLGDYNWEPLGIVAKLHLHW